MNRTALLLLSLLTACGPRFGEGRSGFPGDAISCVDLELEVYRITDANVSECVSAADCVIVERDLPCLSMCPGVVSRVELVQFETDLQGLAAYCPGQCLNTSPCKEPVPQCIDGSCDNASGP